MPSPSGSQQLAELAGVVVGIGVVLIAVRSGRKWHNRPKGERRGISTGLGAVILLFATLTIGIILWSVLR